MKNNQAPAEVAKMLRLIKCIARHTADNPIKAQSICDDIGNITTREISTLVNVATSEGFRICSGSLGYYYARTEQEFKDHLRKERERGIECIKKAVAAQRNYFNHPSLFDQVIQVEH